MIFQPSNITPDEINGTGTIDVGEDLAVSWRVSGDSAMTAYQIDIMQNDTASTAVYSTGKITLGSPFWGIDYAGNVQYYTATITSATMTSAGMTNGNEYKLLITQWWSNSDYVEQTTASLFITRSAPTLSIDAISSPITNKEYSFTATYSQAQGDTVKWVRWQIAYDDTEDSPFLDTGNIYGTGELQVDYDGFLTGNTYSIKCTVETENGVDVTTGWVDFAVSYTLSPASGTANACQINGDNCVWVSWDEVQSADGYSIMRQTVGEGRLVKIADVESTAGQLRDYSACSGNTYIYYVFPTGSLSYLTEPMATQAITVQYWKWAVIEAEITDNTTGTYAVVASHIFRYNASEGSFSNNNSPQLSANFTRYPTRQGTTQNYVSGSLTGYIGTISGDTHEYSDTLTQARALFELSSTENALFLSDPKGNFRRIHTAAASTLTRDSKKKSMPQTVTISWAEVGDADSVHVIMYAGGDYYPKDRVILSSININTETGALMWTVPDNYQGSGSMLSLNADGELIQNNAGSFLPATMSLDQSTGVVSATLADS